MSRLQAYLGLDPGSAYNDTTSSSQAVAGIYFFHPNHLGSVSLVTDTNADPNLVQVVSEVHYKPYGERLYSQSHGPDMFKHKYTTQEEDPETSLMYYGARYYDPGIGRFITADTIVPGSDSLFKKQNTGKSVFEHLSYHSNQKSQTYNRYMYVSGNPIQYRDPSGHIEWGGFLAGLALIAVGAAIIIFAAPIAAAVGLTALVGASWGAGIVTGVGLAAGTLGVSIADAAGHNCLNTCNIGFNTEISGATNWGAGAGSGGGSSGGGSSIGKLKKAPVNELPNGAQLPNSDKISSFYGNRDLNGDGIDTLTYLQPTPTVLDGRVIFAGEAGGYGNTVVVDHGNGLTTRYAHLSSIDVSYGQMIYRGDVIGISGNTGYSTGYHLHFEVSYYGRPRNPLYFDMRKWK